MLGNLQKKRVDFSDQLHFKRKHQNFLKTVLVHLRVKNNEVSFSQLISMGTVMTAAHGPSRKRASVSSTKVGRLRSKI